MTFDFSQIDEIRLSQGAHKSAEDGVCFMEMVSWFAGEKHSDHPACACPVLTAYGIRLNDRMPDDVRNRLLRPLVPLVAGTRDEANEQKRAEFLAMWATNKVLPIILRVRGFTKEAEACEKASSLSEAKSAAAAYAAAANAATAAASATAAAYAAAYAADAAAAAASAANAANAAANAAASAEQIWSVAVEGLRQVIMLGRHDGFCIAEPVLAERHAKLRELVAQ